MEVIVIHFWGVKCLDRGAISALATHAIPPAAQTADICPQDNMLEPQVDISTKIGTKKTKTRSIYSFLRYKREQCIAQG